MQELLSLLPDHLAAPLLAAAGVVTAVWAVARKLVPFLRKLGHLVDDLIGEPPRPGQPDGRPGLMDRVVSLEGAVEAVRHEVEYNHGSSLKDKLREVKDTVDQLAARDPAPPVVQQDITVIPPPDRT